jgi:hypothetical protein
MTTSTMNKNCPMTISPAEFEHIYTENGDILSEIVGNAIGKLVITSTTSDTFPYVFSYSGYFELLPEYLLNGSNIGSFEKEYIRDYATKHGIYGELLYRFVFANHNAYNKNIIPMTNMARIIQNSNKKPW